MQKKYLSLLMAVCSVVINSQAAKLPYDFDLSTKIGELGDVVADIDKGTLELIVEQKKDRLAKAERLLQEKKISIYKTENLEALESSLVDEFSGTNDAVATKNKENIAQNTTENTQLKNKKYDGGWFFGPTSESETGKDYQLFDSFKDKKNTINKNNFNIVESNKATILRALKNQLHLKASFMQNVYVKGLEECKDNQECLKARFGVNFGDIKSKDFFDNYAAAAYLIAVDDAKKLGVTISPQQMKRVAQNNKETSSFATRLDEQKELAKRKLHNVLNPDSEYPGDVKEMKENE